MTTALTLLFGGLIAKKTTDGSSEAKIMTAFIYLFIFNSRQLGLSLSDYISKSKNIGKWSYRQKPD